MRQVNKVYKEDFEQLLNSGLYTSLVEKTKLIPHQIIKENYTGDDDWYATLKPDQIPFISYPYEWCFSQLKDAALLTLAIARESLNHGMLLKDATPLNTQLHQGFVQFIDTLSFEKYHEDEPWVAYRQFCEQFLGPLALMHYYNEPFQELLLSYPEGIPIALLKKLLPAKSRFSLHMYLHFHLQAKYMGKKQTPDKKNAKFSKKKLLDILTSLGTAVNKCDFANPTSIWSDYYSEVENRQGYLEEKTAIVQKWVDQIHYRTALDTGANDGHFSLLLASKNARVISADSDHFAVSKLYTRIRSLSIQNIFPVIINFAQPSPNIGVNNKERTSFFERASSDLVLSLAFIHHLAIGKNIHFDLLANMYSQLGGILIIEFVPREDPKVQYMLQQKKDIYEWYTKDLFIQAFSKKFKIFEDTAVGSSGRTLFLMQKNG
jgi:hypothetical protein